VTLHNEHEHGVKFIEGVEDAEKVSRVSVGSDGEDISNRGW
jgi:hypothetical protein